MHPLSALRDKCQPQFVVIRATLTTTLQKVELLVDRIVRMSAGVSTAAASLMRRYLGLSRNVWEDDTFLESFAALWLLPTG